VLARPSAVCEGFGTYNAKPTLIFSRGDYRFFEFITRAEIILQARESAKDFLAKYKANKAFINAEAAKSKQAVKSMPEIEALEI